MTRTPEGALQVAYVLEGEIDRLRIPPPQPPRLAERLWQHTRLRASGRAYAFTGYREGAQLTRLDPRIAVKRSARRLELEASIPREQGGKLLIGLAAVIEDQDGVLSYWALRHAPGKPDFHHPDAFALKLE